MQKIQKNNKEAAEAELFRLLAANALDYAVFGMDPQGRVTTWNNGAERVLGYREDEIIGQPADRIFTPEDRQARVPEREMRTAIEHGHANDDRWHLRKDGSRFWVGGMMIALRDDAGTVQGFAKIMRDRTDWKLQHEATNSILQTALDCIISMDANGKVLEFNPAAERTFGYRREDVIGRELASLIIPPALRERHRLGLEHYLKTSEGPVIGKRIELRAMHADGTEFPVELAITRVPSDGPALFTAFLRDISSRVRSDQLRNVRFATTQQLTQAPNIEDAATGVLQSICENLRWDVGLFWRVDQKNQALECMTTWHRPELPLASFAEGSHSLSLRPGEGLPGRVWSKGRPAWVEDVRNDANFVRAELAAGVGLHSAFACPIAVGDRTLGVIEFFSQQMREPDQELLETMATVAGHIGQFLVRRQAQDTLRRNERELSDFFDNATIGLHWVGPDGTVLRANRAELDLLGYSEKEYVGRNIAEFHVDGPVIRDILARLRVGDPLHDYPARMRRKDGSIRDVLIHSSALFESGRFVHTRCFTRDITDRKRAEEALRDSESRFRALMEQAPISVQLFSPDGRTIGANRAWSELWGVTLEQMGEYNVLQDPQLEANGIAPLLRRAFAGEPVTLPAIRYDPDVTRHDDPVRWVSAVAYPIKNATGQVDQVVLIHQDRTAETRADTAVRESEEKLRLLADTIPQLAWMAHADGAIFWYNRRWYEYTGTVAKDMEGWGWQSMHNPEVLPEVMAQWKASVESGEPFEMVFPLLGADGQFRPFLTRVNPLRDAQGRIIYWFGTNTDISDIKRMEDELREADRRKDEFLATLAHELRNPLAPIRNSLQLLKIPRVDAVTAQHSRDMMERQVNHLIRLVDDLLDVSRVMRGKVQLRTEPVELATVVAHAVETCQPMIEAKAHNLKISLPDESLRVNADPVRLSQVIGNLLTNAVKYTDLNGHISIAARREDGDVVLSVRDDGIGIAPDVLPHIFDLFVQADHSATRSQGGLGIGLTLVKNLVGMHAGTVDARSAGLSKGAEFIVRLPLLLDSPEIPTKIQETKTEPASSGHRILVVDDNEDAAESLAMLLRMEGHDVEVAYDGANAIDIARDHRPELIFLDIGLPGLDGYKVARRMRAMPELNGTVIAALTGWGQPEDRRRSAEAGFDHHLVKPPESSALAAILAKLREVP
ncbi:MAG: PAS domain S-box protein [Betaproteobacteria bacterium]